MGWMAADMNVVVSSDERVRTPVLSTKRNFVVVSMVVWTLLVALLVFSYISPKTMSTSPVVKNVHIDYIEKTMSNTPDVKNVHIDYIDKSSKIIQDGGIYIHGKYKALVKYA